MNLPKLNHVNGSIGTVTNLEGELPVVLFTEKNGISRRITLNYEYFVTASDPDDKPLVYMPGKSHQQLFF